MSGEAPPWARGNLTIARAVLDDIEAHAREAYPSEACGFITGPADNPPLIDRSVREENIADTLHARYPDRFPRTSREYFEFDALRFKRAFETGQADGRPVKVVYHSHCDHDAYFSDTDAETFAPWGELMVPCAFLVVSVRGGAVRDRKLWIHEDGRQFVESTLSIFDLAIVE
jgi:proteasome lid subunit RPN8/RPN11